MSAARARWIDTLPFLAFQLVLSLFILGVSVALGSKLMASAALFPLAFAAYIAYYCVTGRGV